MRKGLLLLALHVGLVAALCGAALKGVGAEPDWAALTQESARNLSALLKINTTNPPGNEGRAAELLRGWLEREGIPGEVIPTLPERAAFVGRLKGTGTKRPIICMGHLDVVPVERDKWTVDPFGGEFRDGFLWGRGALDDKGMAVACIMAAIALKRQGVELDRDLILLAEGDEEGTGKAGIKFLIQNHWDKIAAEYALNEGGGIKVENDGRVRWVGVGTSGKVTHNIEVLAQGVAGHSSRPREDNAIVHLAAAVVKIAAYQRPVRLTPTTTRFFEALAGFSPPEQAQAMRHLVEIAGRDGPTPSKASGDFESAARLLSRDPIFNTLLRDILTPTIVESSSRRHNVIPNAAKATLSGRLLPSTKVEELFEDLRRVVDDPQISFSEPEEPTRPAGPDAPLDSPLFSAIEKVSARMFPGAHVVPEMATGGTDSMPLLAKGVAAYGFMPFPIPDSERRAHGNDERLPVEALGRGVELLYRVILELAARK